MKIAKAKQLELAKEKKVINLWASPSFHEFPWPKRSIEGWLDKYWTIFRARIHIQTLESIGFHMLEEAGEEAKAVRQLVQFRGLVGNANCNIDKDFLNNLSNIESLVEAYYDYSESIKKKDEFENRSFKEIMETDPKIILTSQDADIIKTRLIYAKMDFVIEMADTFSWMCAVLLKLKQIIKDLELPENERNKFNLEYVLRDTFAVIENGKIVKEDNVPKIKCYVCGETQCECQFFPFQNKNSQQVQATE